MVDSWKTDSLFHGFSIDAPILDSWETLGCFEIGEIGVRARLMIQPNVDDASKIDA